MCSQMRKNDCRERQGAIDAPESSDARLARLERRRLRELSRGAGDGDALGAADGAGLLAQDVTIKTEGPSVQVVGAGFCQAGWTAARRARAKRLDSR